MTVTIDKLPLGSTSFEGIRRRGRVFVDKTDLVVELVQSSDSCFLARPRRFGKSLLVDTFATLFGKGISEFGGLKCESLWNERTYPVLRLDFSTFKDAENIESMERQFDGHLRRQIRQSGLAFATPEGVSPLDLWQDLLSAQPSESLVVLIDEYDAPLTAHLHDAAFFKQINGLLAGFFSATKSYSRKLRFLFVTGIMKFRQASLFSTFNNIADVSLWPQFGSLLGYTEGDLIEYFGPYVERSAAILGLTDGEVYDRLRQEYDGFCFEESCRTHVYAPWSVLSFLVNPKRGFRHYWFESAGTPAILVNYLKSHRLLDPEDFDRLQTLSVSDLSSADHIDRLDPRVLLTHAGYLTIKDADGFRVRLGYPNEEVRDAMARLYSSAFWPDEQVAERLSTRLVEAVEGENADHLLGTLNALVHELDYQDFPIRSEAAVRQLVQVFCLSAGLPTRIEVHSPKGRSDLEFSTKSVDAVFEFKYAPSFAAAASLLSEAKAQLLDRDYGVARPGRRLFRAALVFSAADRKFVLAQMP